MNFELLIQTIALAAIPILFAITLHEAAHGYVARYFGDMTAHQQGRISLNPIRHIDPIGTILLPILMLISSSGAFMFGWAKPVPVNFSALRKPKKDMLWVALAGPASNLFMAFCWALIAKIAFAFPENYYAVPMASMASIGIDINILLMVLNLLPLPPLDGGRIAISMLPHRQAYQLAKIEPYGMFILIFLALPLFGTPILLQILSPMMSIVKNVVILIFGL
jgi:Zn-dependent protease